MISVARLDGGVMGAVTFQTILLLSASKWLQTAPPVQTGVTFLFLPYLYRMEQTAGAFLGSYQIQE